MEQKIKIYRRFGSLHLLIFRQPHGLGSCNVLSPQECKTDIKKCKYNLRSCPKKRSAHRKKFTWWKPVAFIMGGISGFVLLCLFKCKFPEDSSWFDFLLGVSISLITASIVAIVIDFPSRLREYQNHIIEAITDYTYLKSLNEDDLTNLRKATTRELHAKDIPNIPQDLIDLDNKICELIKKPYYKKYRHTIICTEIDKNTVQKVHNIYYELINPYGGSKELTDNHTFTHYIKKTNNDDDVKNYITYQKIEFVIDDTRSVKYHDENIEYRQEELDEKDEFYDTKVILMEKDAKQDGLQLRFYHTIIGKIQYTIKVPIDDICFTQRIKYPAADFRLDYLYNSDEVKLYGQLFGTEIQQSNVRISYEQDNSIAMEAFNWLLPSNGAIVVAVHKKDN